MRQKKNSGTEQAVLVDLVLGPDISEIARARHAVAAALVGLEGRADESSRSNTVLVVSELVANAVVSARSQARVRLVRAESRLRIEVGDDGSGEPRVTEHPRLSESGRGLAIVEQLSASWGVDYHPSGGKTVWTELDCPKVNGKRSRVHRVGA